MSYNINYSVHLVCFLINCLLFLHPKWDIFDIQLRSQIGLRPYDAVWRHVIHPGLG